MHTRRPSYVEVLHIDAQAPGRARVGCRHGAATQRRVSDHNDNILTTILVIPPHPNTWAMAMHPRTRAYWQEKA